MKLVMMLVAGWQMAAAAQTSSPQNLREWLSLIQEIEAKGEVTHSPQFNYVSFNLARGTTFDRDENRSVEYLTLAGKLDQQGEFVPMNVNQVQEEWVRDGENWRVHQTITVFSVTGEMTKVIHQMVIEDGPSVIDSKYSESAPRSGDISAWQKQLQSWKEYANSKEPRIGDWQAKTKSARAG